MAARSKAVGRKTADAAISLRAPRGERETTSFSATDAQNEFGQVLERAMHGQVVVITKHDAPKAVLMSIEEFNSLSRATQTKLNTLSGEFDELLARMQTPKSRSAMRTAFNASPKQLGKAAVAAARKRG